MHQDRKSRVLEPVRLQLVRQSAQPFDTATPGTSEADWLEFLAATPTWNPDFDSLMVVSPHPDDETLAAAGLIRASALRGIPVRVISVTDGEKARPDDNDLRTRRRRELSEAMECLGTLDNPIDIVRLHLPDGAVAEYEALLRNAILNLCMPGTLLVAPFEHDGHTDHDATARASIGAAKRMNLQLARYPIWAWHRCSCESMARFNLVRYELDSGLQRRKAKAVNCFQSQLDEHPRGAIVPSHVLAHFTRPFEAFIL